MRYFLCAAALMLVLAPTAAFAQSAPNLVTGQVPTAAQWNSYFAAKQDYNPNFGCAFSPCVPPIATTPNSILETNTSGTPSFSTLLPSGMTYPNPQFSGTTAGGILSGNFSLSTSGQAQITNTTPSTSPTTGAATIAGGLGIGGTLNVGGDLTVGGNLNVPAPDESPNTVYAGPSSGSPAAPSFRPLAQADLPNVTPGSGNTASPVPTILGRVITPMDFGAVGNGTTDDTTAVQACVNASATNGWPCYFDSAHKYLISSPISSSGAPIIIGNIPVLSPYSSSCPAGIIVNSNIDAFDLSGPTETLRGLCIQMATAAGTRTSGAAINTGATATTQQGHAMIANNTIIFPYVGIENGGPTNGTTQTNSNVIADNLIISPSHQGIINGLNSTGGSTVGTDIRDNQIVCYSANSAATGITIDDGAIAYYGADGGPYQCNFGFVVSPGSNQIVLGLATGVLADSSLSYDLYIAPQSSTNGQVLYLQIDNAWASGVSGNDVQVYIANNSGLVKDIQIANSIFHSGGTGTDANIINIASGANISLTGNHIVADDGSTVTTGINLGANTAGISITGNFLGAYNGNMTDGVTIASGNLGNLCISNNAMVVTGTKLVNNSSQSPTGACD